MYKRLLLLCVVSCCVTVFGQDAVPPAGFESLFDGKTLEGWNGDPAFWSVQDGCLTGTSTPENPVKESSHLIYTGKPASDFEFRADFKLVGGNSGIMYRAVKDPKRQWGLNGYQADMDTDNQYTGIVYGEGIGGILVLRGQSCSVDDSRKPQVQQTFANSDDLKKIIKRNDWNSYTIIAKGNVMTQFINGVKISEIIEQSDAMPKSGTFGFQIHPGPPMTVQYKNVYLKKF